MSLLFASFRKGICLERILCFDDVVISADFFIVGFSDVEWGENLGRATTILIESDFGLFLSTEYY